MRAERLNLRLTTGTPAEVTCTLVAPRTREVVRRYLGPVRQSGKTRQLTLI